LKFFNEKPPHPPTDPIRDLVAWRFGLMALVLGAVLLFALRRLRGYVRGLSRKTALEAGHLAKLLIQSLQAMKYLTATGQHPDLRAGAMQSIRRLTGYEIRTGIANSPTGSRPSATSIGSTSSTAAVW